MTEIAGTLTCPKCGGAMRSYERNGVTVDQCTGCRGVFLDRGELERLIDAENDFYRPGPGGPGPGGPGGRDLGVPGGGRDIAPGGYAPGYGPRDDRGYGDRFGGGYDRRRDDDRWDDDDDDDRRGRRGFLGGLLDFD